ncbi:MAG: hypothetical protein FWC38_00455 [Proteobacteria bacterium]|nr:hypothetical protein [Pseudomonadota bacterium]MCL2306713.1 hypothetical protein [Pseudomonadota bacterium]
MLQVVDRGEVKYVPALIEPMVPDIETVALSFGVISRLVDEKGGKSERIARDEMCDFLRGQRIVGEILKQHIAFAPPADEARAALAVLAGLVVGSRDLTIAKAFQVVECFVRAKCAEQGSEVRNQASGNVVRG